MFVRRVLPSALLVTVISACAPSPAPPASAGLTHVDGLGSLSFPNSGHASAEEPFMRGVLLLHSFEYQAAAEAFREAQAADPGFALAYWGEAMTHNHPLWQQQDREAALEVLGRLGDTPEARAARAPTERERLYLSAVETLYGDGSKHDRDQAYMRAMATLQERFPDDMEARAFHALAILGSRDGVRDFATYMRAAAVAQPVFDRNPDHPGAAHYLIHAFDDPVHAPLGLPAARRYSEIAPRAAHAQHMTSHIFVATGMWQDVVAANIRARDTQDADAIARGGRPNVCGHYSSWLQYGHLMLDQVPEAEALMELCHARMLAGPNPAEQGYFLSMRGRQILDTEDWALAGRWTWDPPGAEAGLRFDYAWVNAFAALRTGDPASARALVSSPVSGDQAGIATDELRGLLAIADGRPSEGIRILQAAAEAEDALPFEFGPPRILKPTHELLGEELLKLGRTQEATAAFTRASERTPGRALVTRGLEAARAQ